MNFKQLTFVCAGMLSSFGAAAGLIDSTKVYPIDEVMVHATRMDRKVKDLPQKVEIITSELIRSMAAENLAEVLKRTTNLDIIQYPGLSATIGMRGFSPSAHSRSYTLLLIDGKPAATTNLAAISLDNVEQIEVVKGSYSVLYGSDAMGGVINVITRRETKDPGGAVSVESGSFGYRKLTGNFTGKMSDKIGFILGYSRQEQQKDYRIGNHNFLSMSETEKLMLDKASYGDEMTNTAYELNDVNVRLNVSVSELWKASLSGIYTYGNDVETPGNYWGSYGQSKKDVNRLNTYFSLERNSQKNHFSFDPYFSRELDPNYSDNTDSGYLSFRSDVKEYGFQLQDRQTIGTLNILGGADYKVYDYNSERWESSGTPADPYKPNNRNINAALFTQVAWSVKKLDVNAGLRFDRFNYEIDANEALSAPKADEKYSTINPSAGVQYRFLKNLKGHASFGTAFSVPDAYKVAGKYKVSVYYPQWNYTWSKSFVGNPDLEPEKSKTYDFGLGYLSEENSLKLDLTYFHTIHDNKIVEQKLSTGDYSYINANRSTMDGIEMMASYNFGTLFNNAFRLELYSNWTWMLRNEFEQESTSGTVIRDMLYARKSNGNLGFLFAKNDISMRLNSRYIGSRLETDSFGSLRPLITSADYYTNGGYTAADKVLKHPDYLLFDYSVNYAYSKHVVFGVMVSNLLDENYSEKDGYNMPGRSIVVKLAYRF